MTVQALSSKFFYKKDLHLKAVKVQLTKLLDFQARGFILICMQALFV